MFFGHEIGSSLSQFELKELSNLNEIG